MFVPNEELEKQFFAWLAQNRMAFLQDLETLLRIPSVSQAEADGLPYGRGCKDILDAALSMAEAYGLACENHQNHCGTATLYTPKKEAKQIGIFTHLDVVPEGDGWCTAPYGLTQRGDYLIGRGVRDDKGPAVMALYALRFLMHCGYRPNNNILLYFGCSEEAGMQDIQYYAQKQKLPDFALIPDNDFPLCYAEKGILRPVFTADVPGNLLSFMAGQVVNTIPAVAKALVLGAEEAKLTERLPLGAKTKQLAQGVEIEYHGIAKHAAFPEGAVNALEQLAAGLVHAGCLNGGAADVMRQFARLSKGFYGEGLGIAAEDAHSGKLTCVATVASLVNNQLTVQFDIRYPVSLSGTQILRTIEHTLIDTSFTLASYSDDAPNYQDKDAPELHILCEIANHVLQKEYLPYTMGGGTYARRLPRAVGFGPGLPDEPNPFGTGQGGGHQPNECILLSSLEKGMLAYVHAMMEIDKFLQ